MSTLRRPRNFHKSLRFVVRTEPSNYITRPNLESPEAMEDFFKKEIFPDETVEWEKENVIVIPLTTRLQPLGWNLISTGTVNESSAHPREIFRPAILSNAYGFVLIHNHPSANTSPSRADESLTGRIKEAAAVMQIVFLDHLIVSAPLLGPRYFSFKEAGLI